MRAAGVPCAVTCVHVANNATLCAFNVALRCAATTRDAYQQHTPETLQFTHIQDRSRRVVANALQRHHACLQCGLSLRVHDAHDTLTSIR
jgi:hypothetical protein